MDQKESSLQLSRSDSKRLIEGASRLTEPLAEQHADPAGGAAAGVVAALAASLAAATADRSREQWEGAGGARAQAQLLRRRALALAEKDADAYAEARAALTERGTGDAGERDLRIGDAVSQAAQVPLQISATAADIAQLSGEIATHGNAEFRADAAIAAVLAAAAAEAAAHLVEINLIAGADQELVALAQRRAQAAAGAASSATQQD